MDANFIRSLIFLIAGLILILFPTKVYIFQDYVLRKFHITHNLKKDSKGYLYLGIVFIIISISIFVYEAVY